jgi:hypothetical protein
MLWRTARSDLMVHISSCTGLSGLDSTSVASLQ